MRCPRDVVGAALCVLVIGCGSSSSKVTPVEPPQSDAERVAMAERAEKQRRSELAAAHREKLDEQSTALAATCAKPTEAKRCAPTCYPPEVADARAETAKRSGAVEVVHQVCTPDERDASAPRMILDELGVPAPRAVRGRFPKADPAKSWKGVVATHAITALGPEVKKGDVVRVIDSWKARVHPLSKDTLRCVHVAHTTKAMKKPLDACGSQGSIACEATGNLAAYGINLVHFRLADAKRLQSAGKTAECQQAALDAIALSRGMPRWRQYVSLNTDKWRASPRYRTRFDGILDEDALFTRAIELGVEAQAVHAACGGTDPKTTVAAEQAFHTCS